MQLNSNSFSGGRASRPRPEPEPAGRSWISLRRGVWVVLAVMVLFAAASIVPSWFASETTPVAGQTSVRRTQVTHPGVKARIKALFGPPRGQRLNG